MANDDKKKEDKLMEDLGEGPGFLRGTKRGLILALVLVLILVVVFCLKKVEPWEVGLRYWNVPVPGFASQGQVDVLKPGYNLIIPGVHQNIITYDCSIKKMEMAPSFEDTRPDLPPLRVRTAKDQDQIDVYVTIIYHVDRGKIAEIVDKEKTSSGIREAYPDNESVREKGIKAVCPNMLQAKLGEIMTASQFYGMTSQKRDMLRKRIALLEEAMGGIDSAKAASADAEKKFLEVRKQVVIKTADLEAARKSSAEDRDAIVGKLESELSALQDQAAAAEKTKQDADTAIKAAEKKALALPLPDYDDMEITPDRRLTILAEELKTLRKSHPTDPYLLDRATQIAAAEKAMNEFFNPRGIEITAVLIWDFKFRDEIEASIMSKVVADEKVELERALKAAANARAIWQKKVAEANAAYEAELARGSARAMELDAEADRYRTEKSAIGDRLILEAQADGKGKINQALAGKAGQVYVGMEYAKALQGVQVIVLPAGGGDGLNPLDLPSATGKAQPAGK